ncbi:MAG TPA: hypothetical protein VGR37_22645 [Longimicrobiaceae bacterium]|nr:hypothetical protein [Longimicrobiaceae bacterium]
MYRPTRFAVVLAALALAGCNGASGPVDPAGVSARRADLAPADSTMVSTTSTTTEGDSGRGVYTLGGGN